MPLTPEQFVRQLVDSGLMSADEARALQAELPPATWQGHDSQDFARELVARRKLTPYQAAAAYQGKAQGLVFGTYVVLDRLGQGGMGTVFKAEHRRMKRVVALKVMSQAAIKSPDAVKRFHREVEAAAKLTHPHIVAALDANEAGGVHFLVMEYVEGSDLAALVKKNGPLPVDKAVQFILQAARGLEHAHREGVIHRDIKPANLLLDKSGTVKILDMGLARLTDSASGPAAAGLTQSGSIMGTVDYMSPEQALHTKYADRPADIYSLGCSLYYLLTGTPVYSGESLMEKLLAHREQPIPSLRALRGDVPPVLDDVFCRMIGKKPEDRYASMTDVIRDLEACLAGEVVSATAHSAGSALGNPFQASSSGTMGSEDPAVQDFLRAISPAASATDVRTKTGTAPASETMASRVGERTQANGLQSGLQRWRELPRKQKWLLGSSGAAVLLVVSSLVGSMWRDNRNETLDSKKGSTKSTVVKVGWQDWPADAPPPAIAPFTANQAKQHQQAWAKYLKIDVEYENSLGMKFVLIPPGEFTMGSTPAEIDEALKFLDPNVKHWHECINSEAPQHKVILTRPFYVGVHEVTQAQYEQVMEKNASFFAPTGTGKESVAGMDTSQNSVEAVSWNDAAELCAKLSQQEELKPFYSRAGEIVTPLPDGTGYRLLTEAEWEFACRAGTSTKYWNSDRDEDLPQAGWFNVNSGGRTHSVDELKSNSFGLHDIHGNVWEWVQDAWEPTYYGRFQAKAAIDPKGPSDPGSKRVFRGGSWQSFASHCRASSRQAFEPLDRDYRVGIRVALSDKAVRAVRAKQPAVLVGTDPDRTAAKYVLSLGRPVTIRHHGQERVIQTSADLPSFEFELIKVNLLANKNVTDAGLANFKNCRNLTHLDLRSTQVTDAGLVHFQHCKNISLLWLGDTGVSDAGLAHFKDCKNLSDLHLSDTNAGDAGLAHFKDCGNLTAIVLNGTHVSDAGLAYLKDCKNLKRLYLANTQVTDAGLAYFKDCKHLTQLSMYRTQISDLAPIMEMPLKELDLDFNPVRDAEILRSIKTLETIKGKPAAEFWKEVEEQQKRKKP